MNKHISKTNRFLFPSTALNAKSSLFWKRTQNGFTYLVEYPDYTLISTHPLPCHRFLKDQDPVLPIPIEKASNLHWSGNSTQSHRQQALQLVRTVRNLIGLDSSPSQLSSLRVLVCTFPTPLALLIGMMTSKRKQHSHISQSTLNRQQHDHPKQ